jgi:hypothetical protein
MGSTGLGASAPTGLSEFASHIHTITVIGTTGRLVALMAHTGQAVLDPMGRQLFAGHTRGEKPGAGKRQGCADSRPSCPRPGTGKFDPLRTFCLVLRQRSALVLNPVRRLSKPDRADHTMGEVRLGEGKATNSSPARPANR